MSGGICPVRGVGTEQDAEPPRAMAFARHHRARRHARGNLPRQPVPAQFGRRHRADLAREMGLSAGEIGLLSSAFFFSFAAAQVPLGIAIDRYGPKRCMLICAAIAFLGTFVFAVATTTAGLILARILMGLGSSCYLMAPLALYARRFAPERFTMLAGVQMAIGTIGTLFVT